MKTGCRILVCGDLSPLLRRRLVAVEAQGAFDHARTPPLARAVSAPFRTHASLSRNHSVTATGARPSGRRNVRPQRPFQTTRTRTSVHHLVGLKSSLEIRSPQPGRTLLRPKGRAPTELLRLSRNHSVESNLLDHRDTMNTEKTKNSLVAQHSLIGDFLESATSSVFLCVHRVSVVFSPVPTEWKRLSSTATSRLGKAVTSHRTPNSAPIRLRTTSPSPSVSIRVHPWLKTPLPR